MPNYVAFKDFFLPSLTAPAAPGPASASASASGNAARRPVVAVAEARQRPPRKSPLFLYPSKRYNYWTPKGFRAKTQNHASPLGNRTSPFISFWYMDLTPAVKHSDVATMWASLNRSDETATTLCVSRSALPKSICTGIDKDMQRQASEDGANSSGTGSGMKKKKKQAGSKRDRSSFVG